jgi:hypothetical protein
MKPNIYYSSWNPFEKEIPDYQKKVSISVDVLEHDVDADLKILYLAEPASVMPELNNEMPDEMQIFDKIYTFNSEVCDKFSNSEFI